MYTFFFKKRKSSSHKLTEDIYMHITNRGLKSRIFKENLQWIEKDEYGNMKVYKKKKISE